MNKKIIIAASAAAVIILVLVVLLLRQRSEMSEMVEQMAFEKEQLENEYEDLAIQFDGYQGLDIRNDSLQDLLSKEQQRVQDLLEELKITKVTNARRISELKKELATVRAVMVQYVAQIDSLSRDNSRLSAENKQMREQYTVVTEQARQLAQSNVQLNEVVTRASMLEVTQLQVVSLNKYDKKTRILSHVRKLQLNYTIDRNVTAVPGLKRVYILLHDPEGNPLGIEEGKTMSFEGSDVPYSICHDIEYGGDTYADSQYFAIGEEAEFTKGFYTADFFIDGQLVGSFPFEVKK